MKPPQLMVFDMAGTTVRDLKEVETCFARAAELTGLKMSAEEITSVQGWSKFFVFQTYWKRQGELENLSTSEIHAHAENSYKEFKNILEDHYKTTPEVLPTEGCLDLFHYLRENKVKIALTTGFYREVVDIILGRLGWLYPNSPFTQGNFNLDWSIAGDEVPEGRPAPDMILKVMENLHISSPLEVFNIGDTPSDLESGKKAGVKFSLGLTNGTHTREQLEIIPNDGLFGSLKEFHDFLLS